MRFEDPSCLVDDELLNCLEPEGDASGKLNGRLRACDEDFIVREPVPLGVSPSDQQYLTIGSESDFGGLPPAKTALNATAMTVRKKGISTWRMIDILASFLSERLGRQIRHDRITVSGLKDRRAVTVQTVVVQGVSAAEMRAIDWSCFRFGRSPVFVKDIRPADRLLTQGDHGANFFEITVRVPNKTARQLEQYMQPRVERLEGSGFLIPNAFQRQRLGPTQNNQLWGRTLLTGDFEPPAGINPFLSSVEALLFRMLFDTSQSEGDEARALKQELMPYWQYNFAAVADGYLRNRGRFNLTLECEVAKRLADDDTFGGCCEAVLYDLRDRLSIAVGAWQAVYWNRELAFLSKRRYRGSSRHSVPLLFSCEDAKRYYQNRSHARRGLKELQMAERRAKRGIGYLQAGIDYYWKTPSLSQGDRPDNIGLSLPLVRKLFTNQFSVPGVERPAGDDLSAALVWYLFLVPRDRKSGNQKDIAPRRRAFVRVQQFAYSCQDGAVTLRFALRSGSYATMLVGLLFDTSDPEQIEVEEN